MIDLNELKPILEKLDVDASVIESVIAIDKEVEPSDNSKEVEELKAQLEQTNKDWNEKFKKAFFSGEGIPEVNSVTTPNIISTSEGIPEVNSVTTPNIISTSEVEEKPLTFGDIAKTFIKEV